MRLAAIYNIWDGVELLRKSMDSVASRVDIFILVYQEVSNHGEEYNPRRDIDRAIQGIKQEVRICKYVPDIKRGPRNNETAKRNVGLIQARYAKASHFLCMDCDELYQDFNKAVEQYQAAGSDGSVCQLYTYFKKPTLRLEEVDNYYVPFIHRLQEETILGHNSRYPYYVDPTRNVNTGDVAIIDTPMHHFSYVRADIDRKCRNSTAARNIAKSDLLKDYNNPDVGPGYYLKDYRQKLVQVPDIFGLADLFKG